jgi:hypothetical protein
VTKNDIETRLSNLKAKFDGVCTKENIVYFQALIEHVVNDQKATHAAAWAEVGIFIQTMDEIVRTAHDMWRVEFERHTEEGNPTWNRWLLSLQCDFNPDFRKMKAAKNPSSETIGTDNETDGDGGSSDQSGLETSLNFMSISGNTMS